MSFIPLGELFERLAALNVRLQKEIDSMPCSDDRDYDKKETNNQIQLLTRVACDLARVLRLEQRRDIGSCHLETRAWVHDHDEADRQREEREAKERVKDMKRQKAMTKLTDEEKALLGL